jgi:predicted nucleic acid-binding protein
MERLTAVADTGFVVALLNAQDEKHAAVVPIYQQQRKIALPQTALTEIAYLLNWDADLNTLLKFLRALPTSRFRTIALDASHEQRVANILETYADSRIDFVDACVMVIAEHLNLQTILTIDRRDFLIFRPQHCETFDLLP